MSYKDYIPTKQSGGFLEGTIFDSTNPFWYNAYQYVPRDYVGLDVDNNLRLILERSKKKTPEMPDLSKFKEKLDKDLLYGEKSILLDRFNTLERVIREELQYNPYALSNNPTIIGYFNELVNMYNSAELQSQIDKKNEVVKQIAKARESGQQESYVRDEQTREYIPVTMGKMAEAFMNSEGEKNRYYSTVFGDLTPKGYRNTTFSNVGKGTEENFTEGMNKVYKQVEENSIKEGGTSSGITYVDAFGNRTNPAYAEGYIKIVSGGYEKNETNLGNLADTTKFFKEQKPEFDALLGEKAQEGFNQLVAKTLNGSSFTNQLTNTLEILKNAKQEAEAIAKKNNTQLKETTFDVALEKATKLLKDKDLEKALSQVSSQKLFYDLSVLKSDKNENVKALVIKSNPVLSLLLSKENGIEDLQTLEQLLNLVKITTQEAIITKNTNFNTIINKQVHREKMTESDVFLSGKGYGGGIEKEKEQAYMTKYAEIINGRVEKKDLKEKEGGLEEAISKLKVFFPKASDEELKNLLLKEAAANSYLTNLAKTKDISKTGMEEIVKGLLQNKGKNEIVNNALNAHAFKYGYRLATKEEAEKYKDYSFNGKVYVKKVDGKIVPLQKDKIEEAEKVILKNIEIARDEINRRVEEYKRNPKGFAMKMGVFNTNAKTVGDVYSSKINPNLKENEELSGETLKGRVVIINGVQVPEEALKYIEVKNVSNNAELTQIPSLTFGTNFNVPLANHTGIIDFERLEKDKDKNPKLKEFYEAMKKMKDNGFLQEQYQKYKLQSDPSESITKYETNISISIPDDQRTLSTNPKIIEYGTLGIANPKKYEFPIGEDIFGNTKNKPLEDLKYTNQAIETLKRIAR